jgi:hypothetical protein
LSKKVQNVVTQVVKKLSKVVKSHHPEGDTVVKKLSKRCPAQELYWQNIGKPIGQTLKPKTRKLGKLNGVVRKKKRPRIDEERTMKKLGIRRTYATSSHLVKTQFVVKQD